MRTIDADKLLKDIEKYHVSDGKFQHWVQIQPTIEPEPQWIPVSERPPEEYGNYLISIDGEEPDIGTINPNDPRGWGLCDANGFYWASDKALNITAWMPLPKSYKEDGETE